MENKKSILNTLKKAKKTKKIKNKKSISNNNLTNDLYSSTIKEKSNKNSFRNQNLKTFNNKENEKTNDYLNKINDYNKNYNNMKPLKTTSTKKNDSEKKLYWYKNKKITGKSALLKEPDSDSDGEENITKFLRQQLKERIKKFNICVEDPNYFYDYYINRILNCDPCKIGVSNSNRGFSPLICSPNREKHLKENNKNNNSLSEDELD